MCYILMAITGVQKITHSGTHVPYAQSAFIFIRDRLRYSSFLLKFSYE